MGFRENLKSELSYSGMLVKELAAQSGVNIYSINSYLNANERLPSAEAAVKIARALGVSVEYLVMGEEGKPGDGGIRMSSEARFIGRLADQLTPENRRFVLDFIKWLKTRDQKE